MNDSEFGYQPDDNYQAGGGPRLEDGDYKVRIESVVTGRSKAGAPMITVELGIAQASFRFKHYIVKNDYFDANMTKFADCFKIPRGNIEFNRWTGRVGKAYLAKGEPKDNGKSYMEIKYLIVDTTAPAPSTPTQKQGPVAQPAPAGTDDFTDDIPF